MYKVVRFRDLVLTQCDVHHEGNPIARIGVDD
jgi:hypothetical protein